MNNARKAILTIFLATSICNSAEAQIAEAIFQRGNSLARDEKYKEALVLVDSSLNMDSSLYQRYSFRADLKVKLGMIDGAIEDLTKCIQRCNCTTRKYHVSDYFLERARLQLLSKRDTEAFEDVNQSIQYNANEWEAYNFRSGLLLSQGHLQLALKDLNKSFTINANEATTLIARGKLKIQLGDLQGACSDLTQVASWGFDEFEPWINENCNK